MSTADKEQYWNPKASLFSYSVLCDILYQYARSVVLEVSLIVDFNVDYILEISLRSRPTVWVLTVVTI